MPVLIITVLAVYAAPHVSQGVFVAGFVPLAALIFVGWGKLLARR